MRKTDRIYNEIKWKTRAKSTVTRTKLRLPNPTKSNPKHDQFLVQRFIRKYLSVRDNIVQARTSQLLNGRSELAQNGIHKHRVCFNPNDPHMHLPIPQKRDDLQGIGGIPVKIQDIHFAGTASKRHGIKILPVLEVDDGVEGPRFRSLLFVLLC